MELTCQNILCLQLNKQLCLFQFYWNIVNIFSFFLHVLEHLNPRTSALFPNKQKPWPCNHNLSYFMGCPAIFLISKNSTLYKNIQAMKYMFHFLLKNHKKSFFLLKYNLLISTILNQRFSRTFRKQNKIENKKVFFFFSTKSWVLWNYNSTNTKIYLEYNKMTSTL